MTAILQYNDVKDFIAKAGHILMSAEYINNSTKLDIKCDKGHLYKVPFSKFKDGQRCPICTAEIRPYYRQLNYDVMKSDIEKVGYKLLTTEYNNTISPIRILCDKGHEYTTTFKIFRKGGRCRKCFYKQNKVNQSLCYNEVKEYIESFGYKLLSNSYINAREKINIQCDNKHIYSVTFDNFKHGYRCPQCCLRGTSRFEKEIQNWVESYISIERNRRFYFPNSHKYYEADIYIPSKNLVIEFDGIWFHSELAGTDSNYHLDKTEFFQSKGIQCIHVFENEWFLKQDIVKSIIFNKLCLISDRIYARECKIKEVPVKEASKFLNENHLQGSTGSKVRVGLYYFDSLVALMIFGKPRYNNEFQWEMIRFCPKLNTSVIGGFSKLLNYFIKNYGSSIITYADRRYSDGGVYLKNGFKLSHVSKPNYFYFNKGSYNLESRNKYQKHKLSSVLTQFNKDKTEWENMISNGYNRIFDCGNLVLSYESS